MKTMPFFTCGITLAIAVVVGATPLPAQTVDVTTNDAFHLTPAQASQVLKEAEQAYAAGLSLGKEKPDQAKAAFATAAQRYQLLIDSGFNNGALQYNLGTALLRSGELGPAIAHYRQAMNQLGRSARIERALRYARALRDRASNPLEVASSGQTWRQWLEGWNSLLMLQDRLMLGLVLWVGVWVLVAVMLLKPHLWKPTLKWGLLPAVVLLALTWVSVGYDLWQQPTQTEAVLTSRGAVLRTGGGQAFEKASAKPVMPGTEMRVLRQQTGWVQVQLPDGQTGWLPQEGVMLIEPQPLL